MSGAPKKKAAEANPLLNANPLLSKPVPHAYALVPDPERRGKFFAVHLSNVVAEGLEHLELSGRSETAPYGMKRIEAAMEKRHRLKGWSE